MVATRRLDDATGGSIIATERCDGTDWLRAIEGRCSITRYLYRIASLILSTPLRHRVIFFRVNLV